MAKHRPRTRYQGAGGAVQDKVSDYARHYQAHDDREIERRQREYAQVVNDYYDLVTDFYEYGWGRHFHFAVGIRGQTLETSLVSHEHYLAYRLHPGPGAKMLDVGCGVGGPMSSIARLTGAPITGVNINHYQVKKGQQYLGEAGLDRQCTWVVSDFLHLPFVSAGFDCAYAIEATCHAPSLVEVYAEIYRALKPGGFFGLYEWCLTDKYDPGNPEHRRIRAEIEAGNGIPSLATQKEVDAAVSAAGFQISLSRDRALDCDPDLPWYSFLSGQTRLENLRRSEVGARLTHAVVRLAEWFHRVPRGTSAVSSILIQAAQGEIAGGRLGIFSPMYFVLAHKLA